MPPARRERSCRYLADPTILHNQESPLGKARDLVNFTFTKLERGLGVGVVGAIVGGLLAREVGVIGDDLGRVRFGYLSTDSKRGGQQPARGGVLPSKP